MRFGVHYLNTYFPALDGPVPQVYRHLIAQVQEAEALGFTDVWVTEHHFHEFGGLIPAPPVFLTALAAATQRIRLGVAISVLPLHHPLHNAEAYAMVDVLSGGRLNLGVGSGYLRHEFAGFHLDPEEKRERFDEALAILVRALQGERVTYRGRYHQVSDVRINVLPVQKPRPPIWIATLRADGAPRVGARGFPVMLIPYASAESFDQMAAGVRGYREAFVRAGGRIEEATVPFGFHCHCAETTAQARAEAREPMERYVRTRLYAVQRSFETLIEQDVVAFGDPDEITRVARRYAEAGFTHFLAIPNFGGLPHKQVLRSLELMARHVLPRFA